MKAYFLIASILLMATSFTGCKDDTSPTDNVEVTYLRCEYLDNPLGIDETKPSLSWQLQSIQRGQKQTAYQVLVASSANELDKNTGDLWDSEKVESDQSIHVEYNGKELESSAQCFWKVRIWDANGNPTSWSTPSEWSMGLLKPEAWTAKWITKSAPETSSNPWLENKFEITDDWEVDSLPDTISHPWLRKTFELKENVERAVVHVNTPSYYELHINGKKVTPNVLTPGISKINKRFLVNTYDVTSLLENGDNCIAIWMGPGWHQTKNGNPFGGPVLRMQLDIETPSGLKTIGTDASWLAKESCISQLGHWAWNDFGGERFDGREYVKGWDLASLDESNWVNAVEIPAPDVAHSWQGCEGAQLSEPVKPTEIYQLENGKWVLDFGRPLTGWMRIKMHDLKPNQEVTIDYADINDNGRDRKLAYDPGPDGFQTFNQKDVFISAGSELDSMRSRFNYHSFRYVIISGLTTPPSQNDVEAMMIEPKLESAGSFESSNELFNQIHEITRYTVRTQSPCLALGTGEAREKSGYGDGGAHLSGYLYNFKCDANLRKWTRDWNDGQRDDGWFGHTAPAFEDHGGGPAWGGQTSALVNRMHLYYGEQRIVEEMYDNLRKYVDFLESKTEGDILRSYTPTSRSEDMMFIGDWARPAEKLGGGFNLDNSEERELFNNCYRVSLWQQLQDYAESIGRTKDSKYCSERLAVLRPLIHKTFFLEDKGEYVHNNQSSLAMVLYADIPPTELRPQIMEQLEHEIVVTQNGHLNTGLLGTFRLLDLLIKEDRNDLVALIMSQTTYPSWGFLIKEMDLTTWPETWSGWGSHVILVTATPGSWFFEGLGGILPDQKKIGFKHFKLKPGIVKSVDWVNCSYKSPYGKITSNWKTEDGKFKYHVEIPANSTATIYVPAKELADVTESGKEISNTEGVTFINMENGKAVFKVESGSYQFVSKGH